MTEIPETPAKPFDANAALAAEGIPAPQPIGTVSAFSSGAPSESAPTYRFNTVEEFEAALLEEMQKGSEGIHVCEEEFAPGLFDELFELEPRMVYTTNEKGDISGISSPPDFQVKVDKLSISEPSSGVSINVDNVDNAGSEDIAKRVEDFFRLLGSKPHTDQSFTMSKNEGINPKDALGMSKPDLSVVPPAAELHLASAMMDGAAKYGPFNWRENKVLARVYVAAARRHLLQFLDGEDFDPDSKVHHLGHAMACCAIILDAFETGCLKDDRPKPGAAGDLIRAWTPKGKFTLPE